MTNKNLLWQSNWGNLQLVSDYDFETYSIPHDDSNGQFHVYFYLLTDAYDYETLKKEVERACKFVNIDQNKEIDQLRKYPIVFVNDLDDEDRNLKVRSAAFMKSSIWNYYWDPQEEDAEEQILWILTEIQKNYEEGRYDLTVAKEYAELNFRLFLNSYLSFDDHSAAVSPFLFHPERKMQSWVLIDAKNNKPQHESLTHSLNWRMLLVDDHPDSNHPMKSSKEYGIGKLDVILDNLRRIGINNILSTPQKIANRRNITMPYLEFECSKTIEEAFDKIKNFKYDIILLDYKLDKTRGEGETEEKQEYGYELLEKIREDQGHSTPKLSPGPNETFYFMFISAYTTAVQERLQMEGFYVSKDYWFIGRGACPTNTPYLFLYSLKRMMDIRYDKLTKHSKQLLKDLTKGSANINEKIIEEEKGKYATMTMFLTKLYEEGNERKNCVKGFNAFLNLRRVYDTIKHDVDHTDSKDSYMKSSPLIMSLFKDEEFCSNSFWEHLQNLVYLTAFGTIRQWPEMWEDYNFIKMKLVKAEDKIWEGLSEDEKKKNTKPSILIRDYILSLKGMMS